MNSLAESSKNSETLGAKEIGASLQSRARLLAQISTSETEASDKILTDSSVASTLAASYMPKFEGMYVLTEISKTQTKLFDYTELIRKNDRVDTLDIDHDGDQDYVFLLGDRLYVKNTHLKEPNIIEDTKSVTMNIDSKFPETANNFDQSLSTPSELNVTFQNTIPNDKEWRMEFYDNYLQWDKNAIDSGLYSATPRVTVDLFLQKDFSDFDAHGVSSKPIERYIRAGYNSKNFRLIGPRIEKFV